MVYIHLRLGLESIFYRQIFKTKFSVFSVLCGLHVYEDFTQEVGVWYNGVNILLDKFAVTTEMLP